MKSIGKTIKLNNAIVSIVGESPEGAVVAEVNNVKRVKIVDGTISVEYVSELDSVTANIGMERAQQRMGKSINREKVNAPILKIRPDPLPAG